MFQLIAVRNGVELKDGDGFKPFKTRRAAEKHKDVMDAHIARHAPLLRPSGVVIEYRIVALSGAR